MRLVAAFPPSIPLPRRPNTTTTSSSPLSTTNHRVSHCLCRAPSTKTMALAVDGATAADLPPVDITWQIVVGSIAGITPFVVAGIEFSKRIIAQRNCEVCGGSGLVLKKTNYVRCPGCGGFLPWQSWKRFFTG